MRKSKETLEGVTYSSNCGLDIEKDSMSGMCNQIKSKKLTKIVYFDLETTGLDDLADIIQIAAKYEKKTFNVFINPDRKISPDAVKLTGFRKVSGTLYHYSVQCDTVPIKKALPGFQEFITLCARGKEEKCLLVARNATFNKRILLRQITKHELIGKCQKIAGFADSV